MICSIDLPQPNEICERMSIRTRGWVVLSVERQAEISAIAIKVSGREVARSATLHFRQDVVEAERLPSDARTGFDLFFDLAGANDEAGTTLEIWAELRDGTELLAGSRTIRLARSDYTRGHFAPLLAPIETDILHRKHIYTAGPSSHEPSPESVALIVERLGPGAARRVLDVGCGAGAYAHSMEAAGFNWMGLEVSPDDCSCLERAGLPYRLGDGRTLPFASRSFAAALCIEVLEHVEDCDGLLSEIGRVADEAVFSVPNCELIPYLSRHMAVPWHVLESTHVNFFSRWTFQALLRRHFSFVEIGAYGPAPLRSIDGAPLFYHLFAHVRR